MMREILTDSSCQSDIISLTFVLKRNRGNQDINNWIKHRTKESPFLKLIKRKE